MHFGDAKGAHKIFKISFIFFACIGTIGSVILFIFSEKIANYLIQIPEAKYSLIALSPSIFFVSIVAVLRGYFNGRQKFTITAKSQSIEQVYKTVFTILLVELIIFIGRKNTTIMAGAANLATTFATIGSFFYILIIYIYRRKELKKEINLNKNYKITRIRKTIKEIIKVSIPISLSSLISSFNKNIDSFTIVRFLKRNITEEEARIQYGVLSGKIDSLCSLPFSINIVIVTILVPIISKALAKRDYVDVQKKSKMFLLLSLLIAIPISVFMFVFSDNIIEILFPRAQAGGIYLKVSSLSIIFMLLAQTENAILQAFGKVNIPPISFGIGMICKLICNCTLIKIHKIGIFGAIIGNIICNIVACVISGVFLYKELKFKTNVKLKNKLNFFINLIKIFISTFFMIFISIFLNKYLYNFLNKKINTIICISVGMSIYLATLYISGIIQKNELETIFSREY